MKKTCKLQLKKEVVELLENQSRNRIVGGQRLPIEIIDPFPMKTIVCDTEECKESDFCIHPSVNCPYTYDCPGTEMCTK